ncbi:TIM barrel protein [Feifania hominis]|uniref:TIM barrel protein n=1 Tax=Feifania hominis TaxID=2763660 RepID=A0A926HTW2_9FIRM|nr:TIM barrel protein [Feifania hominis]MBC8535698.1 TIM barrel protein [Feifania hominis]
MQPKFGPAGSSDSFFAAGYKASVQMPGWLEKIGLDAFEYQCSKGVNVSEKTAVQIGQKAREHHISLSIHAPYYISLSSKDPEKRDNSIGYILKSARCARFMGAGRIVVHSGSCSGMTREHALELAKDTIRRALAALDAEGLGDITVCPETMGKINQLGTLEEVCELCRLDERLIPTIDFGHLNARTLGGVRGIADYEKLLNLVEDRLGADRLRVFHSHFSKIAYTAGGEKVHLTFADGGEYGPEFEPLAELIARKNLAPTIICESAGTQAEDALAMKRMVLHAKGEDL